MTAWRWAALGTAATIIVGLGFGQVPMAAGCPATADQPWLALQHVTSAAAARTIIDACGKAGLITSMWLDALAFIPAFTLFLGASLWALRPPRWLLWIGGLLLAGGFVADQIEGWLLLQILQDAPDSDALVRTLMTAGSAKISLLLLATGWVGKALVDHPRWWRLSGIAVFVAAFGSIAARWVGWTNGETGLALAWAILAVVSVAGAVAEWRQQRVAAAAR